MVSGADVSKSYKNKEWLDEQINVLGKSQVLIAEECGVSQSTINSWLKKRNVNKLQTFENKDKTRERQKEYQREYQREYRKEYQKRNNKLKSGIKSYLYKDQMWLKNQIDVLGKSQIQVARECGVSSSTICIWLNGKEGYNENKRKYYVKNKERLLIKAKKYRENNKEQIRRNNKKYAESHKEILKIKNRDKYIKNFCVISKKGKIARLELKKRAINELGGKCEICGEARTEFLTIDHIDLSGGSDRKNNHMSGRSLYVAIINKKYQRLDNLRVLCYNHNCSWQREYIDLSYDEQTYYQRYNLKLWLRAYEFFGPCPCGQSELKFLTISHIRNDGAERRKKRGVEGDRITKEI